MLRFGILTVLVTSVLSAEVKEEYCTRYAECRQQAINRLSECEGGFVNYYLRRLDAGKADDATKKHCEIVVKLPIEKGLMPLYKQIEKHLDQCNLRYAGNYSVSDDNALICDSSRVSLPEVPIKLVGEKCAVQYDVDRKICSQLAACCPQYDDCYDETYRRSGFILPEKKVTKLYKECVEKPYEKFSLHALAEKKKLAELNVTSGVESSTETTATTPEAVKIEAPTKPETVEKSKSDSPAPEESAPSESTAEFSRDEKVEEISIPDVKKTFPKAEESKNNEESETEEETDSLENDDEEDGSFYTKIGKYELPPPSTVAKGILALNQSELEALEKNRIKTALYEFKKSKKPNEAKDSVQKDAELPSDKKVVHQILCSQYVECEGIVEGLDNECEQRFPVAGSEVHASSGIQNRHIRWHFLNSSHATDAQIREACLKNVDIISQSQIQQLQEAVDVQNNQCTMNRAAGRRSNAEFDGCENVGLVGILLSLTTKPAEYEADLPNVENQRKCKERHVDFARRCRALRSCCPDKIVCDKVNDSKEAKELRSLKFALSAEQKWCEKRLTRVQKVSKEGLATILHPKQ